MKDIKRIITIFIFSIIFMAVHYIGIEIVGDIGFMVSPYFWPLTLCALISIVLFVFGIYRLLVLGVKNCKSKQK